MRCWGILSSGRVLRSVGVNWLLLHVYRLLAVRHDRCRLRVGVSSETE